MSQIMEQIKKEIDSGALKMLRLDESFYFQCQQCNQCCQMTDILLTPYDIARLRTRLNIDTSKFLKEYGFQYIGPDSGLPIVMMNCEKYNGCQFLTQTGCAVYDDRPGCCRISPLIRTIDYTTNRINYYLTPAPEYCPGYQTSHWQTVRQWLKQNQLEEYHKQADWFMKLLFKFAKIDTKRLPEDAALIIGDILFNFDFQMPQFAKQMGLAQPETDTEKFELVKRAIQQVIDILSESFMIKGAPNE
jgi:uncharacterized protein